MSDVHQRIDQLVKSNNILLFMKGSASFPQCGFSGRAVQILKACGVEASQIATVNVLEDDEIRQGIKDYSQWPTIPQLYVKGEFIGGSDIMMEMYESGELKAAGRLKGPAQRAAWAWGYISQRPQKQALMMNRPFFGRFFVFGRRAAAQKILHARMRRRHAFWQPWACCQPPIDL